MSALTPKADIDWRQANVRFVPIADSCNSAKSSFEQYVGVPQKHSGIVRPMAFAVSIVVENQRIWLTT
jgi:hypothetical protein